MKLVVNMVTIDREKHIRPKYIETKPILFYMYLKMVLGNTQGKSQEHSFHLCYQ